MSISGIDSDLPCDVLGVISDFGEETITLAVVEVDPEPTQTDKRARIASMVSDIWRDVTQQLPSIRGSRLLWRSFYLILPGSEVLKLQAVLEKTLTRVSSPAFQTLCVLATASGVAEQKIKVLDQMTCEVTSTLNFGSNSAFSTRLFNGEVWLPEG